MGLPYNVFMTSALVIVARVGIVTWSLLAISRLVDVNRGIATQSLPALRMGTSLREQPGGLTRTEMDARPAAGEPAQKAWNDRAARMAKDFDLLRSFLGIQMERSHDSEEGRESGFLVRLRRHGALPVGPAPTGSER
jgi:hypothetical protein